MIFEYWYMLPVAVLFSTTAMASGVGGATFFSPFLIIVLRLPPAVAIGTGLITEVFGFASGLSAYARKKLVDFKLGLSLLAVTIPAAFADSWLAGRVDSGGGHALIRAMIFDLDGTLVQTEKLKALSYARAAVELRPGELEEADVIEAFKDVVGLERQEAARRLIERFELENKARPLMESLGASSPWQVLVEIRQRYYREMVADPAVIRQNQWPHNIALLKEARRKSCKIGLATMSYRQEVNRILKILHLTRAFNSIASREDVEHGKPHPAIYRLIARELDVPPSDCLVIEDSLNGVKAALGAGMRCIAVATPFTRQGLHRGGILEDRWIVDNPSVLRDVLRQMFEESEAQG